MYNDDFFNNLVSGRYYGHNYGRTPAVNIIESDNQFRIEVAAAGLSKDDFNIHIDKDILTISSDLSKKQDENRDAYTRREFNFGSFSRSFELNEEIDQDNISAKHENGVLTILLPLKEQEVKKGPQSIEIR
jgi:HSP20 family protein